MGAERKLIEFGAGKTLRRLDEMLTEAINGTFEESRYDETELSRLESRWKQYLTASRMSMEKTNQEREKMKALVSDISHQTKTPLSNILLYAQLLGEIAEKQQEKEMIQQLLRQAEKLEFLIQSLVKMSRLETEVLEVVPVHDSVKPLVEQVLKESAPKAEKKKIELLSQYSQTDLQGIEAVYDRKWTAEALGNVLDNAIKYSPEGSTVSLDVKEYGFYVCISVTDQGIGIPEEERAQIFGRFYRGTQVQQEEGIGIGLYLTREILQKENGYIKVNSREGEGSCFGLYLPKER